MAKKIIAINAGHWNGNPKGVPTQMAKLGGTLEFTLNEKVVSKVVEMLKAYEVDVLLNYDPEGKKKIELTDRIRQANNVKADIYLSIHHNAANTIFSGGGTVVYYYQGNAKNQASATKLYNAIKSRTGLVGNRATPVCGTRSLQEINDTKMPAFLVECAFMNSTTDIEYIAKPEWATQVADGIVSFLVAELGLKKIAVAEPVVTEKPVEIVKERAIVRIKIGESMQDVALNPGDTITIERIS